MISVVVVDDNEFVLRAVERMLRNEPDFNVCCVAGTAADGFVCIRDNQPDVAILDYRLPDGTGTALAMSVKKESPGTKMVMLTAYERSQIEDEAKLSGVHVVLEKAVAVSTLVDTIRSLVEPKG